MILKIVDSNGTVLGAVNVYENNYNGEVCVNDTFHCDAVVENIDTIFGTNDSEISVCINKEVMQLKNLVEDAISFFKMVGESDALSDKGFDTGDIMPLEYCDEIVALCKKYSIKCDPTMPYGILDAEYELGEFFKTKLEEAVKGGE